MNLYGCWSSGISNGLGSYYYFHTAIIMSSYRYNHLYSEESDDHDVTCYRESFIEVMNEIED